MNKENIQNKFPFYEFRLNRKLNRHLMQNISYIVAIDTAEINKEKNIQQYISNLKYIYNKGKNNKLFQTQNMRHVTS